MFNILEELFYGNIDPSTQTVDEKSEYAVLSRIFEKSSEELLKRLQDDDKQLLLRIINSHNDSEVIESQENFIYGFRLGARFILDTFIMPRYGAISCEYEEI